MEQRDHAALDVGDGFTAIQGEISIASGQTFSVSGPVSFGLLNSSNLEIVGPGTLLTSGPVSLLAQPDGDYVDLFVGGDVTWSNSGSVTDAGQIVFGFPNDDTDAFINQAGATFDLTTDNASINRDGNYGGQIAPSPMPGCWRGPAAPPPPPSTPASPTPLPARSRPAAELWH